jgi:hypothetical protein
MNSNKTIEQRIQDMQDLIDVQCSEGNYNYDAYMHGMANGMLLMQSLFTDLDPEYMSAPDVWLVDINRVDL